jgi:GxxExxY protein
MFSDAKRHHDGAHYRFSVKVHAALGAGRLESTYLVCLAYQLREDRLEFGHQVQLPVTVTKSGCSSTSTCPTCVTASGAS